MLPDNVNSHLKLHFVVFIWGFTAILGALISLDAMSLVWLRMLFAVLFVYLYIFIKKIPTKIPIKAIMGLLVAGFIIALHWFTFFKAIKVANISVTLACLSSGAFFVSILEPIFLNKKIVWYEMLFGSIVIGALYLIFQFEGNYTYGILIALLSAFFSALFSIINSKYAQTYNPTIITFYELLGGISLFSIFLLFSDDLVTLFSEFSWLDLFYLLLLSSVCTAYAFIASVSVMKHLSAFTVMLTTNLEPVYGIVLAILIFKEKEKMSINFYLGAILILVTVLINAFIKSKNVQK
jgi:drug/metabolite transporter (DMT)-like permease